MPVAGVARRRGRARLFVARPGGLDAAAVTADAIGKQADGEGVAG